MNKKRSEKVYTFKKNIGHDLCCSLTYILLHYWMLDPDWPNGFRSTWMYLFKHTKCTPFVKPRGFGQSGVHLIEMLFYSCCSNSIKSNGGKSRSKSSSSSPKTNSTLKGENVRHNLLKVGWEQPDENFNYLKKIQWQAVWPDLAIFLQLWENFGIFLGFT